MKLKFLFFFLALLLTAVWTILLVLTLKERGALFYIGEGVITFSLVFLVYFYRKVVKPLDIIGNGMELLREQDFSSRLTPVGQKEADRIVLVFNRMMEQLKDERLRLHEQNHFLDLLVSASPMGVVILTLDGHISMLNAAALRFFGLFFVRGSQRPIAVRVGFPFGRRNRTYSQRYYGNNSSERLHDLPLFPAFFC
mgnify:FL=1